MVMPSDAKCAIQLAKGVSVRKHRSADPGVGRADFGSNSEPDTWRLIFWVPNFKAVRVLPSAG